MADELSEDDVDDRTIQSVDASVSTAEGHQSCSRDSILTIDSLLLLFLLLVEE